MERMSTARNLEPEQGDKKAKVIRQEGNVVWADFGGDKPKPLGDNLIRANFGGDQNATVETNREDAVGVSPELIKNEAQILNRRRGGEVIQTLKVDEELGLDNTESVLDYAMRYVDEGEKLTIEGEERKKLQPDEEEWNNMSALDTAMAYVDGGAKRGTDSTPNRTKGLRASIAKVADNRKKQSNSDEINKMLDEVGDLTAVRRSETDIRNEAMRRARERLDKESQNRRILGKIGFGVKNFALGLVGRDALTKYLIAERRDIINNGMGGETEAMQRIASSDEFLRSKGENEARKVGKLGEQEKEFLNNMMDKALSFADKNVPQDQMATELKKVVDLQRAKLALEANGQNWADTKKEWAEADEKLSGEEKAQKQQDRVNNLLKDYVEKHHMVDNFDRLTEQVPKLLAHEAASGRVREFFDKLGQKQLVTGDAEMGLKVRENIDARTNQILKINKGSDENWSALLVGAGVGAGAYAMMRGTRYGLAMVVGGVAGAAAFGAMRGWRRNKNKIAKEASQAALNGSEEGADAQGVMAGWKIKRLYGGMKNAVSETTDLNEVMEKIGKLAGDEKDRATESLRDKIADLMARREIEDESSDRINLFSYNNTEANTSQSERMSAMAKQKLELFEALSKARAALPENMRNELANKVEAAKQVFQEKQIKEAKKAQFAYKTMGAAIGAAMGAGAAYGGRVVAEKVKEFMPNRETDIGKAVSKAKEKFGIKGEHKPAKLAADGKGEITYDGEMLEYDGKFEMEADGEKVDIDWAEKKGGYVASRDPFFSPNKTGGENPALAFGEALKGGNYETAADFERGIEDWLGKISDSPEQTALWAAYTGIAHNVDTYQEVQELADELRHNPALFDELRNAVPAKLENLLEGGKIDLRVIEEGETYPSTFIAGNEKDPNNLDIFISKAVRALRKVHVLALKKADGSNILDTKAFREINGIPEGRDIIDQGICSECGGQSTYRQIARIVQESTPIVPTEPTQNTPENPTPNTPEGPGILEGKTANTHAAADSIVINENSAVPEGTTQIDATPDNYVNPEVTPGSEIKGVIEDLAPAGSTGGGTGVSGISGATSTFTPSDAGTAIGPDTTSDYAPDNSLWHEGAGINIREEDLENQ